MYRNKAFVFFSFFMTLILFALLLAPASNSISAAGKAANIVHSIVTAPITSDGLVAGKPTDFVITLDRSLDPAVPGRTLASGGTIKVTLPDAFINTGLPVGEPGSLPNCAPGNFTDCSSGVILQGWPQHPILPGAYSLTLEGTHTLVYTAKTDIVPGLPLVGPGIKQIHLILLGFRNPKPGAYQFEVEAETGPDGSVERGVGTVHILPKAAPSINVTSTVDPSAPNTIYQSTSTETVAPWPFDVLMWGKGGTPLVGAELVWENANHSTLQLNGETVGHIRIQAPKGATGYAVTADGPSFAAQSPVLLLDTGRMRFHFQAGSATGLHTVTFSLNGGNAVQMFVSVN